VPAGEPVFGHACLRPSAPIWPVPGQNERAALADRPDSPEGLTGSDRRLIQFASAALGAAPTLFDTTWPSLNRNSAGMPRTPRTAGLSGFSSTLTFTILTLPAYSAASSSSAGPIWRQGPHHSAQKSTTTGMADLRTSASKVASVTATVFAPMVVSPGRELSAAEPRQAPGGRQGIAARSSAALTISGSSGISCAVAVHSTWPSRHGGRGRFAPRRRHRRPAGAG
jgi:hypothetical protein